MTGPDAPAVVIGVGNVLLGDDGVGVRLLEALAAVAAGDPAALPPGTRLVDGGTLGLDLLATLDGAGALLVLDAVDVRREPGTVVVLRDDAIDAAGGSWGAQALGGVSELLAVARLTGRLPGHVTLVGIQVADAGLGTALSPCLAATVPVALETALRELRALDAPARSMEGAIA